MKFFPYPPGDQLPYTLIETMSDFPEPVGGVITLQTGIYRITDALVTSDRFAIADGAVVNMFGDEAFLQGFVYTGTGTLFTGTDFTGLTFYNLFLSAPTGTLTDLQATNPESGEVFFILCAILDFVALGNIKNMTQLFIKDCAITDIGTGWIFDSIKVGTLGNSQMQDWKNQTTTMLDLTGTWQTLLWSNGVFKPKSNESLLNIDSGITIAGGQVIGNVFDKNDGGSFFASGSLDQTNKYWKFTGNTNVPDSAAGTELEVKNNVTLTDINTVDTPILVAGTWTDSAERFTTTATGRATYIGLEDVSLGVFSNPEVVLEIGTNKDITIYISKGNDTLNTIASFADAGGGQVTVTTDNAHGLSNGDRVPITGTTNYNATYTIANVTANAFEITETFVATETGFWQIIIERSSASNQIASTTKSSQIPILTRVFFSENCFVEMFAENNSDGTGVIVKNANLLIG